MSRVSLLAAPQRSPTRRPIGNKKHAIRKYKRENYFETQWGCRAIFCSEADENCLGQSGVAQVPHSTADNECTASQSVSANPTTQRVTTAKDSLTHLMTVLNPCHLEAINKLSLKSPKDYLNLKTTLESIGFWIF